MAKWTLFIVKIIEAEHLSHVPLVVQVVLLKFKFIYFRIPVDTYINDMYFFKLGFPPRKDGQPWQGMKLQEKEVLKY